MRRRRLSLVLSFVIVAACGQAGSGGAGGGSEPEAEALLGPEQISFGSSLAQIRGHHRVALELLRAGDAAGARVHAHHPIDELFASIHGELTEHDRALAAELDDALQGAVVATGRSSMRAESAFTRVAVLTRRAESAVVGGESTSPRYRGSVIAALTSVGAHEYEESLERNSVAREVEYQDAYGFVREAASLYESVAPAVEAAGSEEAEEVEEAFVSLDRALPGAKPPGRAAPADDVEVAAELVGHELEETIGAHLLEQEEPEEVAEDIEALLDRVVSAYRRGDTAEASELSAEAYLENYEVIEAEVIEKAPEVNAELEPLLGAELRKRIQEDAPVSQIKAMTARAERLLAEALEALE